MGTYTARETKKRSYMDKDITYTCFREMYEKTYHISPYQFAKGECTFMGEIPIIDYGMVWSMLLLTLSYNRGPNTS